MKIKVDDKFILDYKDHVQDLLYLKDSSLQEHILEELNQEVFYKAILYQDYYDQDKGAISTWLGLLVTHVYDRYLRELEPFDMFSSSDDDSTEAQLVTKDDLLFSTNEHYYYSNKEEIDQYISMLPRVQRKVVYMKLILGYSYAEISLDIGSKESTNRSNFEAGIKNLKRLLEADEPEKINLVETKILKPYGDKSYSGDWAYRLGESPDRCHGEVRQYSRDEIKEYCVKRNLNYGEANV